MWQENHNSHEAYFCLGQIYRKSENPQEWAGMGPDASMMDIMWTAQAKGTRTAVLGNEDLDGIVQESHVYIPTGV